MKSSFGFSFIYGGKNLHQKNKNFTSSLSISIYLEGAAVYNNMQLFIRNQFIFNKFSCDFLFLIKRL